MAGEATIEPWPLPGLRLFAANFQLNSVSSRSGADPAREFAQGLNRLRKKARVHDFPPKSIPPGLRPALILPPYAGVKAPASLCSGLFRSP
jgi:hypothetical protein